MGGGWEGGGGFGAVGGGEGGGSVVEAMDGWMDKWMGGGALSLSSSTHVASMSASNNATKPSTLTNKPTRLCLWMKSMPPLIMKPTKPTG